MSQDWKQIRIQKGLSQQSLANELGVPKQTYVSWEKNDKYPKDVLQKLHHIFQVTPPASLKMELLKTSYISGEISVEEFLQQHTVLYEETNEIELEILALEAYIKLNKQDEVTELSKRIGKSLVERIQYKNSKDAEYLAKLHYLRGNIYYNQKRHTGALEQLLCAEEILEQTDSDKILLRRVLQNIATMISESGNEEDMLRYVQKASDTYKDTFSIEPEENHKKFMAWQCFVKGRFYDINGEYVKAVECFKQAKELYLEGNALNSVRNMEHSIGDMLFKLGEYERSIATILESANEYKADLWVDYQETLAFCYLELGQFEKAEKVAIEVLERTDVSSISIARAYRILSRLHKYKNNRDSAAYYYGRAIDVLYENRLEGSTQAILIEITHEFIDFNKNKSPHAS